MPEVAQAMKHRSIWERTFHTEGALRWERAWNDQGTGAVIKGDQGGEATEVEHR